MKKYLALTLFLTLLINTSTKSVNLDNITKYSQISAAVLKLPLAITANCFDLQNDTKKALIFDSLYCATDVTDLILKICENSDDISPIEIGFAVYHLIKFIKNIKKLSNLETNFQKTKEEIMPNYKTKKTIYSILKYATLIGDSFCSVGFGASKGICVNEYRQLFSWNSGFAKILNVLIDNKNCQNHSKPLFVLTILATFAYTFYKINFIDKKQIRNTGLNFYSILEISRHATTTEIKKAYFKLARKTHPDKCNSQEATEVFQVVSQAYETLTDEYKRNDYNLWLEDPFFISLNTPNFKINLSPKAKSFLDNCKKKVENQKKSKFNQFLLKD